MRARCSCTMQPKAAFCVVVVILCGAGAVGRRRLMHAHAPTIRISDHCRLITNVACRLAPGCHASRVLRGANDGSPRSSSGYPGGWNGGGGGSNWNGGRWNGGGGGWGGAGAAGATAANIVGAVQTGVNVGINLAAPIVNGIASNVPILVPSVGGLCLNGPAVTPFPDRPGIVMCVAGTGADVTNALFNAASTVTNLAGSAFGRRRM